jgi:hypothetical protein
MYSLKFYLGPPCPTLLCLEGGPPLKRPYSHFRGGPIGPLDTPRRTPLIRAPLALSTNDIESTISGKTVVVVVVFAIRSTWDPLTEPLHKHKLDLASSELVQGGGSGWGRGRGSDRGWRLRCLPGQKIIFMNQNSGSRLILRWGIQICCQKNDWDKSSTSYRDRKLTHHFGMQMRFLTCDNFDFLLIIEHNMEK